MWLRVQALLLPRFVNLGGYSISLILNFLVCKMGLKTIYLRNSDVFICLEFLLQSLLSSGQPILQSSSGADLYPILPATGASTQRVCFKKEHVTQTSQSDLSDEASEKDSFLLQPLTG